MEDSSTDVQGKRRRSRFLAFAALAALAVIWGYGWVTTRVALRYAEPSTFAAMRTFLGAVCLFAVIVVLKRPLRPKALPLTAAIGLLQTAAFAGLAVWAVRYSGAGKTSVLAYTMPFWLLLLAWVVLGERLHGLQWLALVLAIGGLVSIFSPWKFRGGILGDALGIGAAVSWAASAVLVKLLRNRHEVDLLSLTAWQLLLGSLLLVIMAAITANRSPVWSGSFVAALLYQVLLATALAFYLWFFVLQLLPAGLAGLGTLMTPVIGVAAAWLQLQERPGIWEGLGMLLIIAALAVLTGRELLRRRRGKRLELS